SFAAILAALGLSSAAPAAAPEGGLRSPPFFRPKGVNERVSERDRGAPCGGRAGCRGPARRAGSRRAPARFRGPVRRRRPCAVRACNEPPSRPSLAVLARGLLAGTGASPNEAAALPPLPRPARPRANARRARGAKELHGRARSEEHTSELQSLAYL